MNINGTEIIYTKCIKKRRQGSKVRIIIVKNNSVKDVKNSCRCNFHNSYTIGELNVLKNKKIKML